MDIPLSCILSRPHQKIGLKIRHNWSTEWWYRRVLTTEQVQCVRCIKLCRRCFLPFKSIVVCFKSRSTSRERNQPQPARRLGTNIYQKFGSSFTSRSKSPSFLYIPSAGEKKALACQLFLIISPLLNFLYVSFLAIFLFFLGNWICGNYLVH